uniref:Uncharacterized protein n=1 Tax=Chromera velia CCMP2878 TaxID=1169474 RepID=A0A0G4FDL9_9ALVE|eukprot:Cvel_16401.t1-p1 / transcript=Cvel_16401.t1 / gene=Cvel_16401 / organism=Chromera_velia_CCMP2878 / gene_product=hypothetical protein / transcript_product=hypothetical protein / location=Cvel_scaffold1262:35562-36768(-) / protein_length=235 / sequence_SO=supercontig / SO=protein_coding / is_pseudo=false
MNFVRTKVLGRMRIVPAWAGVKPVLSSLGKNASLVLAFLHLDPNQQMPGLGSGNSTRSSLGALKDTQLNKLLDQIAIIHSAETVTIIFIMRPAREQTLWSALDTVQRAMTDSDRKVFGHVWTTLLPVSIPSDEGEDSLRSRFARRGQGSVSVGLVIGAGIPPPLEGSDGEGEQGLQAGQEGGSPTNADAMVTAADSVSCVGGSISGSSSASAASISQSGATRGRKKRQKVYYNTV